jgi:catechol 2,3-dioxygenase-like lactoylglutathione lyase family enzyme
MARPRSEGEIMRINLTSVLVDDQSAAVRFYTDVLGFVKKTEIPMGEHAWLTVVSPDDPDGIELVLEPSDHPAVAPFKAALVHDGIPFTSFAVDDVVAEYRRLSELGVRFTQPPTEMGPVTTAVFDDTCGNLIQIAAQT